MVCQTRGYDEGGTDLTLMWEESRLQGGLGQDFMDLVASKDAIAHIMEYTKGMYGSHEFANAFVNSFRYVLVCEQQTSFMHR